MIRFAVTVVCNEVRQLFSPNQGQNFFDTKEESDQRIEDIKKVSSSAVNMVFGEFAVLTLETRPVDCYDSGDAKGIYFDL